MGKRRTTPAQKSRSDAEYAERKPSRHVERSAELVLWGRAAGRCEFSGHNKPLWKSSVTQETVNIAQKAHIYAFSEKGPRGLKNTYGRNDLANLILVCHECHRKLDSRGGPERYSAELLRGWKGEHERRIEIATGIDASKKSHVLLYGANIGSHSSPLSFDEASRALFPRRYPADDKAIELGLTNSAARDHDEAYWQLEARQLGRHFQERVRERLADGLISRLSISSVDTQNRPCMDT